MRCLQEFRPNKRVTGLNIDLEVPRERPQVAVTLNHEAQQGL